MIKPSTDHKPGNWQITATTMKCDYVDDFVTIMVQADWATRCTWYRKHKDNPANDKKQKPDKEIAQKMKKCVGPDCPLAMNYRDKLISEEPK